MVQAPFYLNKIEILHEKMLYYIYQLKHLNVDA